MDTPTADAAAAGTAATQSTLRVNQDCLDIIVEFAVSTPAELRHFRLVGAPFVRAVHNLLSALLCRRRLTGPQSHPGGASLTLRGLDGVRLQLRTASNEQVLRHVLAFAGDIITRFDPRAFAYFSPMLHGGTVAGTRQQEALRRLSRLTQMDVRVGPGQEGQEWCLGTVQRMPATVTELSLPGMTPRFLDVVATAMPQIEDLQLLAVTTDHKRASGGSLRFPNLQRVYVGHAANDLAMEFVHRFALTTTLTNVNLPFQHLDLTDLTLLGVMNGPSVHHLSTVEHPEWTASLPTGLTAETLGRLKTLHGFVVPQGVLRELRSLERVGLRLPTDNVTFGRRPAGGPPELPLVSSYAAELAKACGASLVSIDLDADRRDAADVVPAFTDGYASGLDSSSTRSPLRSFRIRDVAAPRRDADDTADSRTRPIPLHAFHPQRFPRLEELFVEYSPWDTSGCCPADTEVGGGTLETLSTKSHLKQVNVNPPSSREVLLAIGRLAGASLQSLDIRTEYHDASAIIMDAASSLEAHYPALEYLTAPQLCASGWRCSLHKVLRCVSVAVDRYALTEFIEQAAQCPLIEHVTVRDVATRGAMGFDAGDAQPPYRNVLAPFRVHPCPRLVAVNGIYGCDPPREGGEFEFVLSSNAFCWELASFS